MEGVCGAVGNLRREMICKGGWVPAKEGHAGAGSADIDRVDVRTFKRLG